MIEYQHRIDPDPSHGARPCKTLPLAGIVASMLLAVAPLEAWSRAYVSETFEGYTVRCSAVRSMELPTEVLERYEVDADDETGVLSCVVQEQQPDGSYNNVAAAITSTVTNLVGMVQGTPLREVLQGNDVTYISTYQIPNDSPLTFSLVIEPDGAAIPIPIEFEDIRPRE